MAPPGAASGIGWAGLDSRFFSAAIFFAAAVAAAAAFIAVADADADAAAIFAVGTLEACEATADALVAGATLDVAADDAPSAGAADAAAAGSGNAVNPGSTALRPDSHIAPAPATAMAMIAAAIRPLRRDGAVDDPGSCGRSAAPAAFPVDAAAGTPTGLGTEAG